MPNRNIYNNAPESVQVQIYGSNNNIPIQVDEYGNIIISELPGVTLIALPEVVISQIPGITIDSLPEINISGLNITAGMLPITGVVKLDSETISALSRLPFDDNDVLNVCLTSLLDGMLPITGRVGLDADATVSLSGLNLSEDGTLTVSLTPLENGMLPITGVVGLDPKASVSLSGVAISEDGALTVSLTPLENGMLPITGVVGLDTQATVALSGLEINDRILTVSLTPLVAGALPVQVSGMPTVLFEMPIDVQVRPVPLTSEIIQMTSVVGSTFLLMANNYRRCFTAITEGYDIRGLSAYTYLIRVENLDEIPNVSFVAIEELKYQLGNETYFAYSNNQSPEHLLPFNGMIRLHNSHPDLDAISSRVSLMAHIEDLQYRDNASLRNPALVVNETELEIEVATSVYLITKREFEDKSL